MKKLFNLLFACAIGLAVSLSSYGQETVFCIADINAGGNIPINSYGVAGNLLAFQVQQTVPNVAGGAVGLAMDEANSVLFVCYEFSNVINMLDATTMATIGTTSAPGASNLSGLAFDPVNNKLYAMDRNTNHFYSFSWNFGTTTLTNDFPPNYLILPGLSSCWDIALDHINGILYCGDRSNSAVRYYNVGTWTVLAGSYTVGLGSNGPVGVDIDINNQILYTTQGFYGTGVSRYIIGGAETIYYPNTGDVLGVAVNQNSGLIYLTFYGGGTYGDNLVVMDPTTGVITWNSGDLGNPTAVIYTGVGYNPLGLTVTPSASCFNLGQNVTYTLSYVNANPAAVTGAQITFTLPANVTFVSASGGVTPAGNVVTWPIGTIPSAGNGNVTVTLTVNSGAMVNTMSTISSMETGLVTVNHQLLPCTGVPLADWAIYLLIAMIGIAVWFRYRRSIA